ncbi:hypothetical protein DPMN_092566 [Dreissena polymorpha]|uniref:Uncharacterized protein n=1 Tax=Dreissena polymorpha TaxID=45954 RepID=A0A9D4L1K6_DREPO|nr:hypothetical protein DPMN_092566 [Dreissena polymorpha]
MLNYFGSLDVADLLQLLSHRPPLVVLAEVLVRVVLHKDVHVEAVNVIHIN